jgi:hypothetical protein
MVSRTPLTRAVLASGEKQAQRIVLFMVLITAGAILILTSSTPANDTLARVPVKGGLEFVKSDNIRMLEEVLEISLNKIRVKYRFLNESDREIHSTVAFPLPSRDLSHPESVKEATEGTFSLRVNGDPIPTKRVENAETWQQSFPPGKETVVEHSYIPVAGGEYDYLDQHPHGYMHGLFHTLFFWLTLPGNAYEACLDRKTARAIKRRVEACAQSHARVAVFARDVEYILGTGRNWKGPIGKFVLRIEKDSPDHFIATCFPGWPKEVSPTVSEYVRNDFIPPDKLVVYFYYVEGR